MMPERVSPVAQPVLSGLVTRSGLTRRRWLRMLARFTGGSLGLLFAIGLVIAYLITLRPDVPGSRRLAQRELQVLLEPDETVYAVAWARRREWWDGFRETYGILALTDRRALFVGVPPRELVSPERGPQQFVILQLGRDESLRIRRTRVDLGSAPGVSIETDRSRFAFASDDRVGLDSVLANVARNRRAAATALASSRPAASAICRVPAFANPSADTLAAVDIRFWNNPIRPMPAGPSRTAATLVRNRLKRMLITDAPPMIEVERRICR